MLEDRDYMRESTGHFHASMTAILTVVMTIVFGLQCINDVYFRFPVENWLALTTGGLKHGWVWQLLTFQFLHASLFHILCNLIVFWWVGKYCEQVMGTKKMLVALFGCGVAGGILQGGLMLLFPFHFGTTVVGASAGVSGLLAIFALLEKDSPIRLYGILPIRAIALLWLLGGISLFFTLVPTPREGGMAHAAHLGGILAGILWVKLGWHRDYIRLPGENWFRRDRSSSSPRQPAKPDISSAEEFLQKEVDPILEKISAHGIQSLTARERQILEKARSKIDKR
jgi:rhomboid family protein